MNRHPIAWLAILLVASAVPVPAQVDSIVLEMVGSVSPSQVAAYVQTLQDFQTRYTYAQGNTDAGNWLFDTFQAMGLEVERHSFTYGSYTEENIIARIRGTVAPEEIVAIGAHFDSMSEQPNGLAPGADDNASGTASVLEAARIFRDYRFERTVEFFCFNAEEQGRRGSYAIARDYVEAGKNLVAIINNDMIGYWPTGWQRDLDVAYDPVSLDLADHVVSAGNRYVGIPIQKKPTGVCQDDHVSFTARGIPAVSNMDCWEAHNGGIGGETTPHYHRSTDTIQTLNLDCLAQVVQVSVAALAELARVLPPADSPGEETRWGARLLPNRPNPFHPATEVRFIAPTEREQTTIDIYDLRGRRVRNLVDRVLDPGEGHANWDGRDEEGTLQPSGIYFVRFESGAVRETRKIAFMR